MSPFFIYLVVQQTANTPKYIFNKAQDKHGTPSRRKLRSVHSHTVHLCFSHGCNNVPVSIGIEVCNRNDFFAIYLIWSLDVVLRMFEDDSCLVCGLMAKRSNDIVVPHTNELSLSIRISKCFNKYTCRHKWSTRKMPKSVHEFKEFVAIYSILNTPLQQIKSKLQILLTSTDHKRKDSRSKCSLRF